MRTPPFVAALALALACGGPKDGAPSEPVSANAPTPRLVEPEPPKPSATPDPSGLGDPCDDASPCGWDDPCVPSRCVGAEHVGSSPGCDETGPIPGDCMCFAGHCTLRPEAPPTPSASCKLGPCGLEQGAARCTEGTMLEANRYTRDEGPVCHCERSSSLCEFAWIERIECESVEQCWVSDAPPYHPIPRPRELRKRKFRPCHDGEIAPVCSNGRCSVVAYSC